MSAWLLPAHQSQLPRDVNKHHPTLRKWMCAFLPFQKRFSVSAPVTTTHLQPFNPRPRSSVPSLLSFNFPSQSAHSLQRAVAQSGCREETTPRPPDKHTASCNCTVCADRKSSLSLTHTHTHACTHVILTQHVD